MKTYRLLSPFVMFAGLLLVACGEQPGATQDDAGKVAERTGSEAPDDRPTTVAPGASGFVPAAVGEFSLATEQQRRDLQAAGKALCSVDVLNASREPGNVSTVEGSGSVHVVGWLVNSRKEAPREFALALLGESSSYLTKGFAGGPRPDVAKALATAAAGSSGFGVKAALAGVGAGEYEVALVQDTYNVLTMCRPGWRINVAP